MWDPVDSVIPIRRRRLFYFQYEDRKIKPFYLEHHGNFEVSRQWGRPESENRPKTVIDIYRLSLNQIPAQWVCWFFCIAWTNRKCIDLSFLKEKSTRMLIEDSFNIFVKILPRAQKHYSFKTSWMLIHRVERWANGVMRGKQLVFVYNCRVQRMI